MVLTHNSESGEANVNSNPDTRNAYGKLIQAYSKDKLRKTESRSDYVKKLRDGGSVTSEVSSGKTFLQDIEQFAGKNREYDGLEITEDKINYHALVRETGTYFATISNNKRAIKDMYLQEYDINEVALSTKIDSVLDSLSEKQIGDILKSEKKRKDFLVQQFGNEVPVEKSLSLFLKDFNLQKRYEVLDEEHKTDFREIVGKMQSGQKITDIDLEILFESNAYRQKEKEKLLNKLVPSISLKQAKDYGIIVNAQAEDLKYQQVKEVSGAGMSKTDIEDIASQIRDEDITIATSQFTANKNNRDILMEIPGIFDDFARQYNAGVESAKKEIESGNMKKASVFKESLERFPSVHGAEKLQVGSVMQIRQKTKSQDGGVKETLLFGEVVSLEDDGYIKIKEKSHNNKYDASGVDVTSESYSDFLNYISEGNSSRGVEFISMSILTPSDLDAKIRSGDIDEYQGSELKLEGKQQIKNDLQAMKSEIDRREEALNAKEVQLRNDLSKQKLSSQEIQERIDNDPWVKKYRSEIQDITEKQRGKNDKLENLSVRHKDRFIKEINELDPAGSEHGFDTGTILKTKSGHVYTLQSISEATQEVIISSAYGDEPIDFGEFYKAFKDQETKRIGVQTANFGELIDRTSKLEGQTLWNQFEEKSGTIRKKGVSSSSSYDYLVGKRGKNKELLKIHDISGDKITVSFGEISEKKKKDEKDKEVRGSDGEIQYDATFTTENKTYIVTTGFLEDYIKENHLEPRSLEEAKDVTDEGEKVEKMKKNFHLFSWMFHERATINDAIKGGHLFYEQLKEMIEMGSDEKANQFALKYLGGFLTKDAKRDMQSRLEQKQKKTMEEYLERLKTVASDVALEMIQQWLQDKYGASFQKEAAVVFMLEKYGVLNAKAMQKHEGKWWWYQALGGQVGDQLYNELKAEKDALGLPFTEEFAVYRLIKMQCKPGGYNGVKRRSKLHKEIKKIRATGKEEEIETGKRDGKDERDVLGRVTGGMEEMKSGNYPNMAGWLEEVVNKGGPMHVMNKIPFCAAFSGVAYSFEEKITDYLKGFPGSSRILMMLRFFSYTKDLNLLNDTILHVCQSLQSKGDPKYAKIGVEAKELFALKNNPEGGLEVRLNRVEEFYDQYGEVLTDIMYGLNTGGTDDTVNKMIFFEKDDESNPERAQVFSSYFETMKGFMRASETKIDNEDLMTDAFLDAGTSGMDMYKISKELLVMKQGHWKKSEAGPAMWKEVEKEFKAIPHRKYSDDPVENRKMQMKLLKYNLQGFMGGIFRKIQNGNEIAGYNKPAGPFNILNKWGIDMTNFDDIKGFTVDNLLYGRDAGTNAEVEKFANNIIEAELNGATFYHQVDNAFSKDDESVDSIGSSVQSKTVDALKNSITPESLKGFEDPYGESPIPEDMYDLEDA